VRDLEDLIAALERRVPQIDRLGEREIARDAAALKRKAMERLKQLSGPRPKRPASPGQDATGNPEDKERSNR
jgi:hypothetical protein